MIGSLCSGYGGLEIAVQAVLGGEVAWHSEIDPAACKVLEARWPGVPNIGDMTEASWSTLTPVDVLCGGTPCQDVSHAGKRAGMRAGTRSGLWSSMVDAIDVLRPRLVVWENVRGVLSAEADSGVESCALCVGDGAGPVLRALGRVLGDLADLGYDARWCGLRAADVGAPHGRFRVFVAAADTRRECGERWPTEIGRVASTRRTPGEHQRLAAAAAEYPAEQGLQRQASGRVQHSVPSAGYPGSAAADADEQGPQGPQPARRRHMPDGRVAAEWGPYRPAVERWEYVTGRPAPAPTELSAQGRPRLSPRFVEWLMGLPAGWVTDVPGTTRNDQLKMLGNGVVPQQAQAALEHMLGGAS